MGTKLQVDFYVQSFPNTMQCIILMPTCVTNGELVPKSLRASTTNPNQDYWKSQY